MSSSDGDGRLEGDRHVDYGDQPSDDVAACQGAHAWQLVGEDWLMIAVADGTGSAPHYEIGAGTAVKCAVTSLAEHVSQDLDGSGRPRRSRSLGAAGSNT